MNRLRKTRQEKKLTLKEVSEQLNKKGFEITPDSLAKYERGNREPKLETWQKLADFFGVTVPYLQGLEPDYKKRTTETDKKVIEVLNCCYFDVDLDNHNIWDAIEVTNAIDKYASYLNIDLGQLNKVQKNDIFWQKYFSFLFQDQTVTEKANQIIFKKEDINSLFSAIAKRINEESSQYRTGLGDFIQLKYRSKIYDAQYRFQSGLERIENDIDVNNVFDKYIEQLKSIKDEIIVKINTKEFSMDIQVQAVLDAQLIKYDLQAKKLYRNNADFRNFCDNSDYVAITKAYAEYLNNIGKGIDELNKNIEENPILNTKYQDLLNTKYKDQ